MDCMYEDGYLYCLEVVFLCSALFKIQWIIFDHHENQVFWFDFGDDDDDWSGIVA